MRPLDDGQTRFGREFRAGLAALFILFLGGTIAFKTAGGEQWSLFDSFYMTVLTVTTVGYHEVHPLGLAGRWVAIVVVLSGVGIVLYLAGTMAEALLEGQLFWRRRVSAAVEKMADHFIVCGFGRVGEAICEELEAQSTPYVVVDRDPAVESRTRLFIVGDATDDQTLLDAGVERCCGLVTVLGSDAENIYTVLAARSLRQNLLIIARCSEARSRKKLLAAGAQRVLNPYVRGGVMLARMLLRPKVVDFVEEVTDATGVDIILGEMTVAEDSRLAGVVLRDSTIRRDLDIIVAAIVTREGKKIFNPSPDQRIEAGDLLIVMGRPKAVDELAAIARGAAGRATRGGVQS